VPITPIESVWALEGARTPEGRVALGIGRGFAGRAEGIVDAHSASRPLRALGNHRHPEGPHGAARAQTTRGQLRARAARRSKWVAKALIAAGEIKLHRAQEILAGLVREQSGVASGGGVLEAL